MMVYLESNFVLEIALAQEQSAEAEQILELAEQGKTRIAVPGLALSEPYARIRRRDQERRQFLRSMAGHATDLSRTRPHRDLALEIQRLGRSLQAVSATELDGLESCLRRLLGVAEVIRLDLQIFDDARRYRDRYSLDDEDSLIYSSILSSLRNQTYDEPKCFISRDKVFFDSGIRAELGQFNCRFVAAFADGVRLINTANDADSSTL